MKHYPGARLCTRSRVFVCGIRIRYIVEWLNQTAMIMNCGGVALIMDAVIQCLVRGCDEYGFYWVKRCTLIPTVGSPSSMELWLPATVL
jgi:hypothetical protein